MTDESGAGSGDLWNAHPRDRPSTALDARTWLQAATSALCDMRIDIRLESLTQAASGAIFGEMTIRAGDQRFPRSTGQ